MKILVTGADRPLGALAAAHLSAAHDLRLTGSAPTVEGRLSAMDYRPADLRVAEEVAPLVAGMDAVLHLDPYDPAPITAGDVGKERLDVAARGTYVLLQMASQAAVPRAVVASTMALFESYSVAYLIDETWQPQPTAHAESLAPMMSELSAREFARQGELCVVCLRFGALSTTDGTTADHAVGALEEALALEFKQPGYRWQLFHVVSSGRFTTGRPPLPLKPFH
jgi:nucleoside-diphosphate-sugar epimerase